ncbi:MAG TPA: bifunctional hydroxymethylpyrimidine kinase/phosphomethylpyrimidine kinase [Chloroflexota bacterium]|nr:bifunctional hydroxymethylpyrimidine kinase/phosphomethylpyrimidine kinase [Chloroflexota bacterium]
MTIAGSDSSAGAGIQADLKTFQALGVYGASAITAITAQNTLGVRAVHEIPPQVVAAQIDAVVEDLGVDAAKTGMLSSASIIEAVAERVRHWGLHKALVLDPVMVAKSGDRLLREDAVRALIERLLPLAAVVTPNLAEAEVMVGRRVRSEEDMHLAAREVLALGPRAVVMKGGHLEGDPVDLFFDGQTFHRFPARRVETTSTHGTGCTFAAAIAVHLAQGAPLATAVGAAKAYLTTALERATPVGQGHGPVKHDWPLHRIPPLPEAPHGRPG